MRDTRGSFRASDAPAPRPMDILALPALTCTACSPATSSRTMGRASEAIERPIMVASSSRPLCHSTRYTRLASALPRRCMGPRLRKDARCTGPRADQTFCVVRICAAPARSARRAAELTVSPKQSPSISITSPDSMPICICTGAPVPPGRMGLSRKRFWMLTQAASASPSCGNTTNSPSPSSLTTRPLCCSKTWLSAPTSCVTKREAVSSPSRSNMLVLPTRSAKTTVVMKAFWKTGGQNRPVRTWCQTVTRNLLFSYWRFLQKITRPRV